MGYQEFEDYVLGKEDGVAKTPEWASPKCGVPEWTIKALAREWAKKATTTVTATVDLISAALILPSRPG